MGKKTGKPPKRQRKLKGGPKKKRVVSRKLSAYNIHMRRELKGKLAGKTKAQRKAIFKAAARKWKGKAKTVSRSKPKSASPRRSSSTPRRVNTTMGKNSFNMSKIYSLANKVAFVAPYAAIALDTSLTNEDKVDRGIAWLSGYSIRKKEWRFEWLKNGWTPYVMTKLVTAVVPKITSFVKGIF